MAELIERLQNLNGYRFTLQRYKINHSELLLSAIRPDDTSFRFNIGFANVHYIQMPISWIGSFVIGSDSEREEIINRIGLHIGGFGSAVELFKSLQNEVLILGALMLIKSGNLEY